MNVAGAQNTLNTDVIEGEFTAEADSDVGSGDIPIPDDLLTEGEASARYPLPEALVKTEYEIVLTRSAPPNNNLVVYDPGIAERILIASRLTDTTDWAYYQQVAESFAGLYPGRIAHIRDLLDRLRDTLEDLRRVQRQAQQERLNLNARNNFVNERIETDLKELRGNWEKQREALRVAIRETEEKRIAYRMSRQPEVDAERKRYYETKEKWNQERDERQKTDEERRWQESEQNRRSERERATERTAAQSKECSDAWQNATEAQRIAQDAEAAAYEAAQEAAGRLQTEIEATDAAYDEAFKDALARLDRDEAALREAAHLIEQALLTEKRERETELHRAELSTHDARTERERQSTDQRVRAERAIAAAGLMPDATTAAKGLHGAVIERLPGELVSPQANIKHLAFPEKKSGWFDRLRDGLSSLAKLIALVAFGSIFGVSLGLLTGFADFGDESLSRSDTLFVKVGILCGLSIFVFYLMGRALQNAWVYAEEERHADQIAGAPLFGGRYLIAAALASTLTLFFIGIEATVEKKGIVDSYIEQSKDRGRAAVTDSSKEIAYWTIALVVSVPFVLYHSYAGAMGARYRLGERARADEIARLREDALKAPEVVAACEAHGVLQAVQERLIRTGDDFAPLLSEKKRRIAEIEAELTSHPALRRLHDFVQNRPTLLHNAPELRKAVEARDAVRDLLENDATLKASKDRAAALHQQADAARQSAEALRHANYSAASAEPGASPASNAVTISANALSAEPKWEEMEALERWRSIRQAIFNDPQIHFYRNRVKALQSSIRSLDDNYRKRKKELAGQTRAVRPGPQPVDPITEWQIRESLVSVEAVQMAVDEETQRLIQLTDGPALIRWFHNVGQHLFFRSPMRRRIQAAQRRRRALPEISPSVANAILPVRSEP